MQSNLSYILLLVLLFCTLSVRSQEGNSQKNTLPKKVSDTIPTIKKDSLNIIKKDSVLTKKDTLKPVESLEGLITHDAIGYTNIRKKDKTLELYDQARITYTDIDLKAGIIIVNYVNNTVFAKGIKDSTGYVQRPVFKQGTQESEQDSLIYNFTTKRAIIYGIKTKQEPGVFVLGEKAKRQNDSTYYIYKTKFTTSDKDKPDYYIGVNKAKVVPGKKIVAGFSNLVIADVPTPVFLPFAYFPIGQTRSSGFIIPAFNTNGSSSQGIGLENGGYYFAINDYLDLEVIGSVYSNGSWSIYPSSQYVKRYKFSGNVNLRFEKIIQSIRGFDDFSERNNFNLQWNHRTDPKSSPNSSLTASVNFGSSQFFRQSLNFLSQANQQTNTFNSSVSYQKTFVGTPFNMSVNITHQQNTNTETVNMTLPALQLNMNRIYPFAGKGGIKKNPLQNIGITYNLQGDNRISIPEEDFLTSAMFDTAVAGLQHRADANTNITLFTYFNLSPNIRYTETWNFNYINQVYDPNAVNTDGSLGAAVIQELRGFRTYREYSTSLNLSTNIYGNFNFKKGRLKAIRHTIRPSVSFSYTPDFATRFQEEVQQSNDPSDILTYSPFQQSRFTGPNANTSGSIGFAIDNVLEAKVAPKDPDSDEEDEKIFLLNNLNFRASYNIAADSLRWSNIAMNAGTRLLKDKLALNFVGSFDPYQVNDQGVRIDEFNSFPRLASANLTANYRISSKDFGPNKDTKRDPNAGNGFQDAPSILDQELIPSNRFASTPNDPQNNKTEEKKTELYRAKIPWSLSLNYSALYTNNGFNNIGIRTHSIGFNGDIELSPKWRIGFNSGYDIVEGGFTLTRLNFSRDLDSWRMNFNWTPFGPNQQYTFFIGVKSSVLSDLKYDQNRPPNRVLF